MTQLLVARWLKKKKKGVKKRMLKKGAVEMACLRVEMCLEERQKLESE